MTRTAKKPYMIHAGKNGTFQEVLFFESREEAQAQASDYTADDKRGWRPQNRRFYARLATPAEVAEYERQAFEEMEAEYRSIAAAESGAGWEAIHDANFHRQYPYE